MKLECSLDLGLDNVIQSYSLSERDVLHHSSYLHHKENSLSHFQEKDDLKSYQRSHEEPTIIIIPGHLNNLEAKKARRKKPHKKTRFVDYHNEELNSKVFHQNTIAREGFT